MRWCLSKSETKEIALGSQLLKGSVCWFPVVIPPRAEGLAQGTTHTSVALRTFHLHKHREWLLSHMLISQVKQGPHCFKPGIDMKPGIEKISHLQTPSCEICIGLPCLQAFFPTLWRECTGKAVQHRERKQRNSAGERQGPITSLGHLDLVMIEAI